MNNSEFKSTLLSFGENMTQVSKITSSSRTHYLLIRSFLVFVLSSMLSLSPVIAAESTTEKKETSESVELKVPKKKSPSLNYENTQIQPSGIAGKASSEYYSTIPDAKLLVPVHVWGEIREPGLHFVPLGSSISEAISSSGGPLTTAAMPEVELRRKSEVRDVNLFKAGFSEKVAANDTIIVERSMKADLPLYFGAISVLVSLSTLIVLLSKTFK